MRDNAEALLIRHELRRRAALTPLGFAARVGFEPDEPQRRLLTSRALKILVNCTRQWGKSTTVALMAVHQCFAEPGSLVLMVSPSERQSSELLWKAHPFVRALQVKPKTMGALSIEFHNGSRIVALPGSEGTILGFSSVALLVEDEAAKVSDDLHASIKPMLAVTKKVTGRDPRHILMATPFGQRGHFYRLWTGGAEDWERHMVRAEDCERIDPEFLAAEKRELPDFWYRQSYCCEFVGTTSSWFDQAAIRDAFGETDLPVWTYDICDEEVEAL